MKVRITLLSIVSAEMHFPLICFFFLLFLVFLSSDVEEGAR